MLDGESGIQIGDGEMRILLQLRFERDARPATWAQVPAFSFSASAGAPPLPLTIDPTYPPVPLPFSGIERAHDLIDQQFDFAVDGEDLTYLLRGSIPDGDAGIEVANSLREVRNVVGVFVDPIIEPYIICPGDPAMGSDKDVAALLNTPQLHANGMDGHGAHVAVVDTGINMPYLWSRGRPHRLTSSRSWTPRGMTTTQGSHPVDHGTMCAYSVGIAAPLAQLLDHAALLPQRLRPTGLPSLLSDAIASYSNLLRAFLKRSPTKRTLVVTNSWGMYSLSGDFPPGTPGNYSDSLNHPFNIIVDSLQNAGADVLFAAGNCGRDCPDRHCNFGTSSSICGANSHPSVICVAGVDIKNKRVGYSSQGPGRLDNQKPDIAGYTHFTGSEVYPVDSGTSTACPVVAGVVAAIRSVHPPSKMSPPVLSDLLRKTANRGGHSGFSNDYGWGVIDVQSLLGAIP